MSHAALASPGALTNRRSRFAHPAEPTTSSAGRVTARRAFALLTPLLFVAGGLAACSKDEPNTNTLPDGATLVSEAAAAMGDLKTVHMQVSLDPPIGDVPLARADIDLTDKGESAGEVQIEMAGNLVGVELVVTADGTSWLKFPGANWAMSSLLADYYDTSAILDPDRGIAKLLATATDAQTKGSERAGGVDAWKIEVGLNNDVVERLVPADLPGDTLTGTIWVDKESKRLVKAVIMAPPTDGSQGSEITFTITAFDAPVTISDPTN